jgi:dipeptidyl aminopeptidase/acylaminoacyl peptidase
MKRAIYLASIVVTLYLVLCGVVGIFVADGALHPFRRQLDARERSEASQIAQQSGAPVQDVELKAPDGVAVKAWLIQPAKSNGDAVLLLHGLGDNRGGTLSYAQILLASGYAVLMPDARAHGDSGGLLGTYGLLERNDIRQWTTWLENRVHPNCVFGFGESMGAAQLLQSLSAGTRFCAVVAESPFSDFREIAYDRMGQQFGAGPWVGETLLRPVVFAAFLRARLKYGLNMQEVSPEMSLRSSKTPVFLIHGAEDHNIPPRHSEQILRNRPQGTEIWRVPGVDHCGTMGAFPEELRDRLLGFYAASATLARTASSSAR